MGVYLGSNAVDMQGGFVTGGASGASLQSKTVSPSESAQTVKADNGYDGLSQVTVNAVSKTYVGSGVAKKKREGTITVVIGEPMYAEGEGPRAIAALNDRAAAWNEAQQRAMGSLPPEPVAVETPAA